MRVSAASLLTLRRMFSLASGVCALRPDRCQANACLRMHAARFARCELNNNAWISLEGLIILMRRGSKCAYEEHTTKILELQADASALSMWACCFLQGWKTSVNKLRGERTLE